MLRTVIIKWSVSHGDASDIWYRCAVPSKIITKVFLGAMFAYDAVRLCAVLSHIARYVLAFTKTVPHCITGLSILGSTPSLPVGLRKPSNPHRTVEYDGKLCTGVFYVEDRTDQKEKPARTLLSHGVNRMKCRGFIGLFGRKKNTTRAELLTLTCTFVRQTTGRCDTYTKLLYISKVAVAYESDPTFKLLPRNTLVLHGVNLRVPQVAYYGARLAAIQIARPARHPLLIF